MKIVFLARYFYPHVGGVEKQVYELSRRLETQGHQVTVVTTRYQKNLKSRETVDGIKIIRFTPLPIKFLGLLSIWIWMIGHFNLFRKADIVHAHSVLIWYWPLRLILPKRVFVTFHGWEGIYPIPAKNKLIRKIDAMVASKNITIHDYVTKHYEISADKIMYTSVDVPKEGAGKKDYRQLVYVGRLDKDTGLPKIMKALEKLKGFKVDFCGDGPLRKDCEKYGTVHGFADPTPFLKTAFICLSPGVTSILEAFAHKCLVATTYNNPIKKDYLLMTPFADWIEVKNSPEKLAGVIKKYAAKPEKAREKIEAAYDWVKTQNWNEAVRAYEKVWQR
jgi:glycosyltransferase involved in cell wall biosynthesis